MRDELPRFNKQSLTEVSPLNLQTPQLTALANLGRGLVSAGEKIGFEQTQKVNKALQFKAGTDIAATSEQLNLEAQQHSANPMDQKQYYDKSMQSYLTSYVTKLPDGVKEYAKQIGVNSYLQAQKGFDTNIIKQARTNQFIDYDQAYNQNVGLIPSQVNAQNYTAAQKSYQRAMQLTQTMVSTNQLKAKDAAARIEKLKHTMQDAVVLHKVDALYNKDPDLAKKYIGSMVSKGIPGYTSDEVLSLATRADTLMKTQKAGVGVDKRILDRNWSLLQKQAFQTGTFNQSSLEELIKARPESEDFMRQTMQRNVLSYHLVHNVLSLPRTQQDEALQKIEKRPDVDLIQYSKIASSVGKAHAEIQKAPHKYFANNPAVVKNALTHQMVSEGLDEADSSTRVTDLMQTNPDEANLLAQKWYGMPANKQEVISNDEATGIVQEMDKLGPQERLQKLNQLYNKYSTGDERVVLGNQLSRAGLGANLSLAHAAVNSPANQPQLQSLVEWLGSNPVDVQKSIKDQGIVADDVTLNTTIKPKIKDYIAGLHNYQGNSAVKTVNQTITGIRSYAKYLLATGKSSTVTDAVQTASDALVNNNVNTASINGKTIILPKEIPSVYAKASYGILMNDLKAEKIAVPQYYRNDYRGLNEEDLEANYKESVSSNAYLMADGAKNGMHLVDGNGNQINVIGKDKKQTPIFVSYQKMNDPDSPFYKSIMLHYKKVAAIKGAARSQINHLALYLTGNIPQ